MWRIRKLKDRVLGTRPSMDLENAKILTESFMKTEGEPLVIRKAKAFREQCERKTINGKKGWQGQEEGGDRVSGLPGDGRLQLRVAAQTGRREAETQEVLPSPAETHRAHGEEEVVSSLENNVKRFQDRASGGRGSCRVGVCGVSCFSRNPTLPALKPPLVLLCDGPPR